MKQELIDIINRFKSSPSVLLTVINQETGQPLVRSISAARMEGQYGSVEAFFNGLLGQGIRQIIVEERRKLGNTTRSFSTPKSFTLGPKEEVQAQEEVAAPTPIVAPAPMVAPSPMQQGLMGMPGLGFPQIMDLHVRAHDQARLETENKFLKEKNERLEQEMASLKEERLADKFSEAKAKGNNEMLLGIVQNLPALWGLFKGAPSTGLQGAEGEIPQLPEGKTALFQALAQTSAEVDAFMLKVLHLIFEKQEFYKELSELVSKQS